MTIGDNAQPYTDAQLDGLREALRSEWPTDLGPGHVRRFLATIDNRTSVMLAHAATISELTDALAARDAEIAAKQEALRIGQQTIERLLAERDARDAEIARLRVPGALETGRNGGWQEMIDVMREQKRRTNVDNTALRARVVQLEAVLRRLQESGNVIDAGPDWIDAALRGAQ